MNTSLMHRGSLLLAFLSPTADRAFAQRDPGIQPPAQAPLSLPNLANAPSVVKNAMSAGFDEVLFDEAADGALWTRGRSFKAEFDGQGATILPFFGSDAPQHYPLDLRVSGVTLGGSALPFSTTSKATRAGKRVSIGHGAFVEQYEIDLESLEQRFVFDTLPRNGDLVLKLAATTELAGSDLGTSLRFENELGRIDYSEAFAVDAAGRKISLDSTLVDGAIQLVVPASFLASAALPLTIDPFITFFTVSGVSRWEKEPDVSYDVTTDRWCVSWSDIFTATDYDAYVRLITGSGLALSTLTIDFTSETWTDPHIANNNANDVFLVVASHVPPSGISDIRGRLVTPATSTVGPVIQISPLDGAYRNGSDVGGDTWPTLNASYFAVVWQRSVNANNNNIELQMVNPNGTLQGSMVPIDSSVELDTWPSISNSTECVTGSNPAWTVVWERRVTSSTHAIYGAQLTYSGSILHPTFLIDPGHTTYDSSLPEVSTVLDNALSGGGGERPYLVTFERNFGDKDIIAVAMRGTTILGTRNLTGDYAPAFYSDQLRPSVDSDGSHFLVGWTETIGAPGTDVNVWVSDYYLSGTSILPCEVHGNFAGSSQAEGTLIVSSMASGGGPRQRYFGTWQYASINNLDDIQGGLWDGCPVGGVAKGYCFGDGTGMSCPCGNFGGAGRGCASSANASGAQLGGSGNASMGADTFQLQGQGMPPSSPCLYFQGTLPVAGGSSFGDGLLCLGGTITRLGVVFNNPSGQSTFPTVGALSSSSALPLTGGERYYQVWYRDAAPFCTSATFNLTNGLNVSWSY